MRVRVVRVAPKTSNYMSLIKEINLYRNVVDDKLSVVYMPVIELDTNTCIGAEILLRYVQSNKWIGPTKYIETLKEIPVGNILLTWLMSKAKEIIHLKDIKLSLNCPGELLGTGIIGSSLFTSKLLDYTGSLIIEITETGVVNPKAREVLRFYKRAMPDLKFALDDTPSELDKRREDILEFIDVIKFKDPESLHIELLKRYGDFSYICEFIEDIEDVRQVVEKGVNYGQGWYYSPGLTKEEFIKYYKKHGPKGSEK